MKNTPFIQQDIDGFFFFFFLFLALSFGTENIYSVMRTHVDWGLKYHILMERHSRSYSSKTALPEESFSGQGSSDFQNRLFAFETKGICAKEKQE